MRTPASPTVLPDDELVGRLAALARSEREATGALLAHLVEMGRREIHLRLGYGSLYAYCREVLRLSEHDAYERVSGARAVARFPAILELLREGAVTLTAVRLLAPHLTPENHREILESARGKRRAEVEQMVARLAPWPEAPDFVRRLPGPGLAPGVPTFPAPPVSPTPGAIAPDRYRIQLTVDGDTVEKLRLARDMLRHALPLGDGPALLDRALSALLAELARKKFAAAQAPRAPRGSDPDSRHIPAEVRRAVWLRDVGRCAFVGASGRRCEERGFLEFHHVTPFAAGGKATVENIELRCRRHNQYESRPDAQRGGKGDESRTTGA
jgi:hypothetical protein